MSRKIDGDLLKELKNSNLLKYIIEDSERIPKKDRKLLLEIIHHEKEDTDDYNKIGILCRRIRILQISHDEPICKSTDEEKFQDKDIKKLDEKTAIEKPQDYFGEMIPYIEKYKNQSPESEADSQQKIATWNDSNSEYIIIDKEYQFQIYDVRQGGVKKSEYYRPGEKNNSPIEDFPIFDLLGIEKSTGNIVLFELKKGTGKSLTDKDHGIKSHIDDFEYYFGTDKEGKESKEDKERKEKFKKILKKDIEDIIQLKEDLGVLKFPKNISINDKEIKFMFIFEPKGELNEQELNEQESSYRKKFINQTNGKIFPCQKKPTEEKARKAYKIWDMYPTIEVDSNDYTLSNTKIMPWDPKLMGWGP